MVDKLKIAYDEGYSDAKIRYEREVKKETAKQMCFSLERKKPTLKKLVLSKVSQNWRTEWESPSPAIDLFFDEVIKEIKQKYGVKE